MDSDEDINSPSRSSQHNRGWKSKKKMQDDGGVLASFYSPTHEAVEPLAKRRSATWLNEEDTMTFVREVTRPTTSTTSRPMTAMSQADLIPDLEDMDYEAGVAVKAPLIESSNLTSYHDLEKDILRHTAFASFENIDMSPLFARLIPEEEIVEDDTPWTWDTLIASVSSRVSKKDCTN